MKSRQKRKEKHSGTTTVRVEAPAQGAFSTDTKTLDSLGRLGGVDEVNGRGAMEVPAYVPTRHELEQLAKYWAGIRLDSEFDSFTFAIACSSDVRRGHFARRRLNRIADALGDEEVTSIARAVTDEFRKTVAARSWEAYWNGDTAARDALLSEAFRALDDHEEHKR